MDDHVNFVAGARDAISDTFDLVRLRDLDNIFRCFVNTNIVRGTHLSMDQIIAETTAVGGRKLHFSYEHMNVKYMATTYVYTGPDADWIDIKLANNGYNYVNPVRGERIPAPRHNSDGWIVLPKFQQREFQVLTDCLQADEIAIMYNSEQHRVDMIVFPSTPQGFHYMITFEDGTPYVDARTYLSMRGTHNTTAHS